MPLNAGNLTLVEGDGVHAGLRHAEVPYRDGAGLLSSGNDQVGVNVVERGTVEVVVRTFAHQAAFVALVSEVPDLEEAVLPRCDKMVRVQRRKLHVVDGPVIVDVSELHQLVPLTEGQRTLAIAVVRDVPDAHVLVDCACNVVGVRLAPVQAESLTLVSE